MMHKTRDGIKHYAQLEASYQKRVERYKNYDPAVDAVLEECYFNLTRAVWGETGRDKEGKIEFFGPWHSLNERFTALETMDMAPLDDCLDLLKLMVRHGGQRKSLVNIQECISTARRLGRPEAYKIPEEYTPLEAELAEVAIDAEETD